MKRYIMMAYTDEPLQWFKPLREYNCDSDSEEDVLPELKRVKSDWERITDTNDRIIDELHIDGDPLISGHIFDLQSSSVTFDSFSSYDWGLFGECDKSSNLTHLSEGAIKKTHDTSLECRLRSLHIQKTSLNFDPWSVITEKDADGDNLLFIAIITLKTQLSKSLIDMAPVYDKLTIVNKLYQTALHLAAITGNYLIARRLLVAGAKVDDRDYRLNTPLHIAVGKGFIKVAKALMTPVTYLETKQNQYEISYQKIPQNLEIFNAAGLTCLHVAGHNNDKPMIDLLLSNEADLNARELKSGRTLLHYFAEVDNIDMVKYLISKSRLILDKHTYCGVTAAELAYSRCRFGIAYLLCSSGANDVMSQSVNYSDSESDSEN